MIAKLNSNALEAVHEELSWAQTWISCGSPEPWNPRKGEKPKKKVERSRRPEAPDKRPSAIFKERGTHGTFCRDASGVQLCCAWNRAARMQGTTRATEIRGTSRSTTTYVIMGRSTVQASIGRARRHEQATTRKNWCVTQESVVVGSGSDQKVNHLAARAIAIDRETAACGWGPSHELWPVEVVSSRCRNGGALVAGRTCWCEVLVCTVQ